MSWKFYWKNLRSLDLMELIPIIIVCTQLNGWLILLGVYAGWYLIRQQYRIMYTEYCLMLAAQQVQEYENVIAKVYLSASGSESRSEPDNPFDA
jgi:hypothetical protein